MMLVSRRGRKSNLSAKQLYTFKKCVDDPVYFLSNFFKPVAPGLNKFQHKITRSLLADEHTIVLGNRLAGTTTVVMGFLIWEALFKPDQFSLIGAPSLSQAVDLCEMLAAINDVPAFLRPQVTRSLRNSITFANGSIVKVGVTSGEFTRGLRLTRLYLDNFAGCTERVQTAAIAALNPCNGRCVVDASPGTAVTTAEIAVIEEQWRKIFS